jgi:uncharacterized protein YcaQ
MSRERRIESVPAKAAGRALLAAQGLLADPAKSCGRTTVRREIERLGFVQVDSINVVERAHHHILASRLDGYRPAMLTSLCETERSVFENWTHDAAVIPTRDFPHWRPHFTRLRGAGPLPGTRWARKMGDDPGAVVRHVLRRIRREGPLMSSDFQDEPGQGRGQWWDWKPEKTALEYLWRAGRLCISSRKNFHKRYDLTERVIPEPIRKTRPRRRDTEDWACRGALERLCFATHTEIARFYHAVSIAEARAWCERAEKRGEIESVFVGGANQEAPRRVFALAGWRDRLKRGAEPPARMRLLSPFDPALRDRARTQRLFGFEYAFEAFVPAAKRRYGYYVLPILDGGSLVGRVDAKLHRDRDELVIRGPWWEPAFAPGRAQRRRLDDAVGLFAEQLGAARASIQRP